METFLFVLLLILKILGIILAVILGLALLLVLLVLFVPVRYRGKGSFNGTPSFQAKASYLFHILSASFILGDDEPLKIKLFGFTLYGKSKNKKDRKRKKKDKGAGTSQNEAGGSLDTDTAANKTSNCEDNFLEIAAEAEIPLGNGAEITANSNASDIEDNSNDSDINLNVGSNTLTQQNVSELISGEGDEVIVILEEDNSDDKESDFSKDNSYEVISGNKPIEHKATEDENSEEKNDEDKITEEKPVEDNKTENRTEEKEVLKDKSSKKKKDTTGNKKYDKIKGYLDKIQSEEFKKSFELCKKQIGVLLKAVLPKKWKLEGSAGFEDPSTTGKLCAVLGMLSPWTHKHIFVTGDFESSEIDLKGEFKGRIYGITLLIVFIRVYFNKNIKRVIKMFNE